jgi:hypothetical protein
VTSIDELEKRVATLEQQSVPDSIQSNIISVGPGGVISGINLPVAQFSSGIRWVRQQDGAFVASISEQNFYAPPNSQQKLQFLVSEPNAGPNVDSSIEAVVSIQNPVATLARSILEVGGSGIYAGAAGFPLSDFCLQERLTLSLWVGTPNGFVIDSNFRIYNLGGGINFQNSSINPTSPWNGAGAIQCPLNPNGGYLFWAGAQGGVSGCSMGIMISAAGGATIFAGNNAVSNFASSPGNSNISTVSYNRFGWLTAVNWSGWNSSAAPVGFLGICSMPFDAFNM